MNVLADKRKQALLAVVREKGEIIISHIASRLGVSEMTVRRDLRSLQEQGLVVRVHGGALPTESGRFDDRLGSNAAGKARAALKLAEFLPRSGSIYLDGSTTILNLIPHLRDCRNLQAATNNAEAFRRIAAMPGVDAVLIGGVLDRRTDNLVGPLALNSVHALAFDAAFFSAWCMSSELGLMELTIEDSGVKEVVAQRSQQVYLAVDSSKLNRTANGAWHTDPQRTVLATDLDPQDARLQAFRPHAYKIL